MIQHVCLLSLTGPTFLQQVHVAFPVAEMFTHLFVGILMCFQCFHDSQLRVVLEPRRLVPQDLPQDTQCQGSDWMLCQEKQTLEKD